MNWGDLQILHALSQSGSMSTAARSLGISQPTASRRLRAIEDSLGARLFDRLPSGLEPTEAGKRFLPLLSEMDSAAAAVGRVTPSVGGPVTGRVRISLDEVAAQLVIAWLPEIRARAPGVQLELLAAHDFANLTKREVELLIRSCLPREQHLIARKLGSIAYGLYGAADRPARVGIHTESWIGLTEHRLWYPRQKAWLEKHFPADPILSVNDMASMQAAIRQGVGQGLLPCALGDADPDLQRIQDADPALSEMEYLLIHRDVLREPAVRAAVDAIVAVFQENSAQLLGTPVAQAAE
ncbi:LysR family transcriptional regulator [Hwanghaeella grinnelliae]|uniref:LysR family transcriptional regulator n=1 Tax=Hwanghaeella grinnelliae TaxID=2500179 RepID=A0A437QKZ1_9PROT|nr:LysR family transcriptional regulator [Hwanghaeella grinnelliae]RVU35184.1 LysR family transcriptional regulator [Hwanghaeella grinnelliae]